MKAVEKPKSIAKYCVGIAAVIFVAGFIGCGQLAETPSVRDDRMGATIDHAKLTSSCAPCHEKERPAESNGIAHWGEEDCVLCHQYAAEAPWTKLVEFTHNPTPEKCDACHEKDRPDAPHPAGDDCKLCHTFPEFKKVHYAHDPKPAECGQYCHTPPEQAYARGYPNQGPPDGFADGDPGSGHLAGKDCASCHLTPPEGATTWTFDHSKPVLDFCLPCHFNQGEAKHGEAGGQTYQLDAFGNCGNCHKKYDKAVERSWGL